MVLAAALATVAAPAAAETAACAAPRVGPAVASLPEAWRRAVEELVQSAATPGRPWSCAGGSIDLAVRDGGATLTIVTEDGRAIVREVTTPDEIVPLGEALLARPLPPPAPPILRAEPAAAPPPPADPRVLLSALIGPRYAGASNLLWGSVAAAAVVPIGAWGVGAWGRFDGPVVTFDDHRPAVRAVCFGASGSRSFALGPVELRASVVPSVAIVTGTGEVKDEETRVDGRIGLEARGVVPITRVVRAVAALDVELSPRELAERHEHGPHLDFPSYTLGFGLGVEVAIR